MSDVTRREISGGESTTPLGEATGKLVRISAALAPLLGKLFGTSSDVLAYRRFDQASLPSAIPSDDVRLKDLMYMYSPIPAMMAWDPAAKKPVPLTGFDRQTPERIESSGTDIATGDGAASRTAKLTNSDSDKIWQVLGITGTNTNAVADPDVTATYLANDSDEILRYLREYLAAEQDQAKGVWADVPQSTTINDMVHALSFNAPLILAPGDYIAVVYNGTVKLENTKTASVAAQVRKLQIS